jgi:hypothetical protein
VIINDRVTVELSKLSIATVRLLVLVFLTTLIVLQSGDLRRGTGNKPDSSALSRAVPMLAVEKPDSFPVAYLSQHPLTVRSDTSASQ